MLPRHQLRVHYSGWRDPVMRPRTLPTSWALRAAGRPLPPGDLPPRCRSLRCTRRLLLFAGVAACGCGSGGGLIVGAGVLLRAWDVEMLCVRHCTIYL
jgi:hypothetical protein